MARCGCSDVVAEGCACQVTDSDCFTISGSGSVANPFAVSPILDPDAANMMACGVDGLGAFLPTEIANPPACRVFSSANQNILTATDTTITFDSERFDTDTMWVVGSPTRITCNTAGVYIVTFCMTWSANASGDRKIRVRLNGSTLIVSDERSSGQNDPFDHSTSTLYKFAAGDYIEAYVGQNSGVTLQSEANGNYAPEFAAVRVAVG